MTPHTASLKSLYFNVYVRLMSSQHERYHDHVSMDVARRQRLNQACHIRHGVMQTAAQYIAAHLLRCVISHIPSDADWQWQAKL